MKKAVNKAPQHKSYLFVFLFHLKKKKKTEETLFEIIHISLLGDMLDGKNPEQKKFLFTSAQTAIS